MNEFNKKELSEMDIRTKYITFPVTYDGESGALFVRTNEQQVEMVVLMTLKNNG